ncbi:MAG: ABC transporter ATP-binding protein [Acidimicrobiales bacterium]
MSPEQALALSLHDVSAGYKGNPVVSGVSFGVDPGGWVAIIGPNGAGKSTVLKAIVGLLDFEGSIIVGGQDRRGDRKLGAKIGYVPQRPILPLGMTTAEYVLLGRTAHLGWLQSESKHDRQRVMDVLEQLDLAPMAGRSVSELSGGEGQRVTLARALVQEATVLVLDEPTSALDLAHQISVLEVVDSLRREHDLAVVTAIHDLSIASRFADRLVLVADGGSPAIGTPAEVLTESTLSRYYGTPVAVMDGPDGGLVVLPLRQASTATSE